MQLPRIVRQLLHRRIVMVSALVLLVIVVLALGAIALPLFTSQPIVGWLALVLALAAETMGRYLFFGSAVPKHLAAPYLGSEAA